MKFALLYSYDPMQTGPTEQEFPDWLAFDKEVKDAGIFVYEAGFHDATTAKTVSVRDDKATTENAPIASAGNVIAGLYVIEVASVEDAIAWAQKIPTATYGKVEVRQIVEF
jgi:hypothetical protein